MIEEWKEVVGWPEYAVSSCGQVKRLKRNGRGVPGKILAQFLVCGYPSVNLTGSGKRASVRIHRLVAEAFLPRPEGATEVNHIDATRDNNHIENLEWVTSSGNRLHAYRYGALSAKGSSNGHSKLTESDVIEIRRHGNITSEMSRRIAPKFNVSPATIRDVAARRTWAHI